MMSEPHIKTSDSANDRLLFKRIKAGDYESFKFLFEGYYKVLCNYSLRFIDEHYIADDIVQEVFIKIWEKRRTLEIKKSVKSYLYTAIKNGCLNHLKSAHLRRMSSNYFLAEGDIMVDDSEIEQEEFRNHLFYCIEKLPPRCKEVFLQSRFENLKQDKISASLNITLKTVKAQIGKALRLLKNCLQPYYPDFF